MDIYVYRYATMNDKFKETCYLFDHFKMHLYCMYLHILYLYISLTIAYSVQNESESMYIYTLSNILHKSFQYIGYIIIGLYYLKNCNNVSLSIINSAKFLCISIGSVIKYSIKCIV